ncbi:MAG: LysR substrate-binding domain-containing protein [Leptothrix sp. (in: b-proteobacteria)]
MSMLRIPPIQCLLTFEAVARLRSASQAADELSVTPSAVSHRIRQLEAHLGFKLFGRNDFSLTADGASYLANVRIGLQALRQAPGQVSGRPSSTRLRLAVTPTFSRQMLLPRLALFRNAYPDVELIMQVTIPLLNVKAEEADLEIRYGAGGYSDVEELRILSDAVSPVCSPEYLHEFGPFHGFASAEEVAQARLIRSPLDPWNTWFKHCGIALPEPRDGSQFNDVGLMLDAAASGFGVTLLRLKLGAAWLESGRLVRLSEQAAPSPYHHYICWKPGALERWECAAFVEWLRESLR